MNQKTAILWLLSLGGFGCKNRVDNDSCNEKLDDIALNECWNIKVVVTHDWQMLKGTLPCGALIVTDPGERKNREALKLIAYNHHVWCSIRVRVVHDRVLMCFVGSINETADDTRGRRGWKLRELFSRSDFKQIRDDLELLCDFTRDGSFDEDRLTRMRFWNHGILRIAQIHRDSCCLLNGYGPCLHCATNLIAAPAEGTGPTLGGLIKRSKIRAGRMNKDGFQFQDSPPRMNEEQRIRQMLKIVNNKTPRP